MITEAVIRVILHCSRCNTRFTDDFDDDNTLVLWDPKELAETFPAESHLPDDDACGWKRIGDRVLCEDCWTFDDTDDEAPAEKAPLSAVEDAKLNRERAGYTSASALKRVLQNAAKHAEPGDDWVRVTRTGGAA